jgi:tRNA pseudouridine55 synthase
MLLAIDKPLGRTSYDCIRYIKHKFPKQKIGHAGTLDPGATGLLIIAVGWDTKTLSYRLSQHKSYRATIDFSQSTDTRDLQFRKDHTQYEIQDNALIIDEKKIIWPTVDQITGALDLLVPEYEMPVPAFSAKKIKWAHSYDLARAWHLIQQNKMMKFDHYHIIGYVFPVLTIEVTVWSGTYIRSLAYRLGQQFGCGGILTSLMRTSIGAVSLPVDNTLWDEKLSIQEIMIPSP